MNHHSHGPWDSGSMGAEVVKAKDTRTEGEPLVVPKLQRCNASATRLVGFVPMGCHGAQALKIIRSNDMMKKAAEQSP